MTGLMGLAHGPVACMNHQLIIISQVWSDDSQQPEHHPLVQTKYDTFVTSVYYQEFQIHNGYLGLIHNKYVILTL